MDCVLTCIVGVDAGVTFAIGVERRLMGIMGVVLCEGVGKELKRGCLLVNWTGLAGFGRGYFPEQLSLTFRWTRRISCVAVYE